MSTRVIFTGRFARYVDRDGWEYVERTNVAGIVAIAALTDDGNVVLVEQHRPPVDRRVIELPAGLAGDDHATRDEPLEQAARRELREETGYEAETMERVLAGTPSAGIIDEVITFFRARGLRKVEDGGGDASEEIEVHEVPLSDVTTWLAAREARGRLVDLKVYVGLHVLATT